MSIETQIFSALKSLVSSRVYRDVAPQTVIALPRITFQQVGGTPYNFLEPVATSEHVGRFQVNVWHESRDAAMALMKQAADALRAVAVLQTRIVTAPVAILEEGANVDGSDLCGAMQDFTFWVSS